MRFASPATCLASLQIDGLRAIKNGAEVEYLYWYGKQERDLSNVFRFRRSEVLKRWPALCGGSPAEPDSQAAAERAVAAAPRMEIVETQLAAVTRKPGLIAERHRRLDIAIEKRLPKNEPWPRFCDNIRGDLNVKGSGYDDSTITRRARLIIRKAEKNK